MINISKDMILITLLVILPVGSVLGPTTWQLSTRVTSVPAHLRLTSVSLERGWGCGEEVCGAQLASVQCWLQVEGHG